jgi:hypothetical protein
MASTTIDRHLHPRRRLRGGRSRARAELPTPLNPAARPGRSPAGAGPKLHESHGDPLDIALPAARETLPALGGERQDRRWPCGVLFSAGLELAPLVVHRHPDQLSRRRWLFLLRDRRGGYAASRTRAIPCPPADAHRHDVVSLAGSPERVGAGEREHGPGGAEGVAPSRSTMTARPPRRTSAPRAPSSRSSASGGGRSGPPAPA